jgi:8-oxo-dGTP pyrophosphatase MutT (NUDIX family)
MVTIPQKATTIILLREGISREFEVYLLKRHENSSFMGGNYVYPGGRIDPNDHDLEICPRTRGISPEDAQRTLGTALSFEESLACWTSGIRELFEEAGVLLAYNRNGAPLTLGNPEERKRYFHYREEVQKGSMTLCQLAQREQLLIALDQLHYYAHWITPEARPQRFDTYFFVARHPEGQEETPDEKETTVGIWITPRQALKENLTGEIVLSPPTLKTLEDLSRYKTIDEVFDSLKGKQIRPILPFLTKVSDETVILFPWDPEYERFTRGEIPTAADHGKQSGPADNTTRVIFRNGRWIPHCREASIRDQNK